MGNKDNLKRKRDRYWLVGLVMIAISLFLLWQIVQYEGLVNRLGEWQFSRIGEFFPAITLALIVIIIGAWIALILKILYSRKKETDADAVDGDAVDGEATDDGIYIIRRLRGAARAFFVFAGVALVLTFIAATDVLGLIGKDKPAQTVTLAQTAPSEWPEGPVHIKGVTSGGPIGRLTQNMFFFRRTYFYLPVESRQGGIDLVVELTPDEARNHTVESNRTGYLRQDGFPRETAEMYRNANYPVASSVTILYLDAASARWRPLMLTLSLAIATILLSIIGLLFRRAWRRTEKELRNSEELPVN